MRRGFTLIEMLAALVVLLVAAAIGGELFYKSILAINAERSSLKADSTRTSLLRHLREDCTSATAVSQVPEGVELKTADAVITYQVKNGAVTREDGSAGMHWPIAAQMSADGAAIEIAFDPHDRVSILSPFALSKGGKP